MSGDPGPEQARGGKDGFIMYIIGNEKGNRII
jgi:hypothetical protein